nr:hypothetical protein [uncultured Psychroserpens sp.]
MKPSIDISIIILILLFLVGCQNINKDDKTINDVKFGNQDIIIDNLGVELNLNQFNDFKELLSRVEDITCNDSIPKITLDVENEIRTVYFSNPCWENFLCILIKERNVIEIENDSINKSDRDFFGLDSLNFALKRDIDNNGKNPRLARTPEKLMINISVDGKKWKEKLVRNLELLTSTYTNITGNTNLTIVLVNPIKVPPPPPPLDYKYIQDIFPNN